MFVQKCKSRQEVTIHTGLEFRDKELVELYGAIKAEESLSPL